MRKKVRFLLAGLLVADVLLIGYLMYDYIQNKIPDSVLTYVGEKQELDLPAFFKTEQSVPALHVQNQDGSFSMKSNRLGSYEVSVRLFGVLPVKRMDVMRSKVGLVFQYPDHQLFETTCFEDVCFGPKNQGLDRRDIELRAFEALRNVGFPEELFYQPPFDLSGGQKRRVAIAGVLAMKPDVLILDEPTAGLDPAGRDEILGLVSKMHRELGITILLVSHSMEDVAEYVDRIIVMNHGAVMFDALPKQVFAHYKELEAVGLAAPQVTYLVHELAERGLPVDTQQYDGVSDA